MKIEQVPVTGREDKNSLTPPLRALAEFYEALNGRDMEKMARNWAQSDEAVMDNPLGGIKRGWEEIRGVYERLFNSRSEFRFEFYDYTFHTAGEIFYVAGRERGEFRVGETVLNLAIRTSRIFRLMDGCWRQVHHHGSIDDPDLLASYQKAVLGRR
ncbi:nuclear transport factor 2 family protein [Oryzomonas japonica]|uniref:Nuclear transport factor 2 family protein n=1 Tax=Oryzomonas japonica TaxID=2603858 RepID=A0A7J4ZVA8_9BACT|nr:nuclear transport factor 2 family protein [Oryzomonas japonica]KAB0667379.1 nuclear transport factor 2 family protein [Oryzomonas japonica]